MAKAFDYQSIINQFKQLQDAANQANEARYQEILGVLGGSQERVGQSYDKIEGLLQTLGQSEAERINMGATRQAAQMDQDLISRGLGNTTVRAAVQRGVTDDQNRAQRELTEQVSRQRAGVEQSRAAADVQQNQFLAQMMNARTDQGPDIGMFTSLLQQAAMGDAASQPQTIFTGMSPNARAGLDAFGRPMGQFGGATGSGGGGTLNTGAASMPSGGGSGGSATPGTTSTGTGAGVYVAAANQSAAQRSTGGSDTISGAGGTQGLSGDGQIFSYLAGGNVPSSGGTEWVNDSGQLDLTGFQDWMNDPQNTVPADQVAAESGKCPENAPCGRPPNCTGRLWNGLCG